MSRFIVTIVDVVAALGGWLYARSHHLVTEQHAAATRATSASDRVRAAVVRARTLAALEDEDGDEPVGLASGTPRRRGRPRRTAPTTARAPRPRARGRGPGTLGAGLQLDVGVGEEVVVPLRVRRGSALARDRGEGPSCSTRMSGTLRMAPVLAPRIVSMHHGQAHDVDGVGRAGALDRLDLLAHPVAGAGDVLAGDSHGGRLTRPRIAPMPRWAAVRTAEPERRARSGSGGAGLGGRAPRVLLDEVLDDRRVEAAAQLAVAHLGSRPCRWPGRRRPPSATGRTSCRRGTRRRRGPTG